MRFHIVHENYNVTDLDRSLAFYREALGLHEVRRVEPPDGSFILCYVSDETESFQLELTWVREHPQPYDLGENEFHLALLVDDMEAAHEKHAALGCICFENPDMGIYFIEDPDGYWFEIVPEK